MMSNELSRLAYDVWRASGARTADRLLALVAMYGETYFGPAPQWSGDVRALIEVAQQIAVTRALISGDARQP